MISEINPNPNVCVIPQNYRKVQGDDLVDMCVITGYPNVSWSVDVYNVWLAQNSQMLDLNLFSQADTLDNSLAGNALSVKQNNVNSALAGAQSASYGNLYGVVGATVSSEFNAESLALDAERLTTQFDNMVAMQIAEKAYHAKLPNDVHFGSNNTTLIGYNLFDKNIFTRYSIKAQFAKQIDDYFSMYGYATNLVKIPNINNRPNWNFIKTIDVNIVGDIPQSDLSYIKAMFNNGFTLWHNPNTFLDYSKNNK